MGGSRNTLIPVTKFRQGQLGIEEDEGPDLSPGCQRRGRNHAVKLPGIEFSPFLRHGTCPWKSDRSCSCSCSRRQPAPYQKVSSSDAVGQDDSKANMPMSTGKIQEMARSVLNRLDFITRDELNLRTSWASQGSGRQRRKTLAKKRGLGGTDTSKGEGRRRRKTQAKERGRTQAYSGLRKKQLSGAALPDAPLTHAFLEEFMKWGTLFVLNR